MARLSHRRQGLGLAWIVTFRRLAPRYDRHAAVLGFLHLACALIGSRLLARAEAEHD